MRPNRDFSDLFSALNDAAVEYLLVGGYALAFHDAPRFTGDVDVWVNATGENARRVLDALRAFGAPVSELSVEELGRPGLVVQIGVVPNRVDVLTSIDGVSFEEAWPRRVAGEYGGHRIHVISKDDLIRNKLATGREQDALDVQRLRRDR